VRAVPVAPGRCGNHHSQDEILIAPLDLKSDGVIALEMCSRQEPIGHCPKRLPVDGFNDVARKNAGLLHRTAQGDA
jgi:hypothetical protein